MIEYFKIYAMENSKKTIDRLNNLILVNNDRIEIYENALKEMAKREDSSGLEKRFFLKFIKDSRRYIRELGNKIKYLRKTIKERALLAGRHGWIPLKNAFASGSRQNLLRNCALGEGTIEQVYKDTLSKINAGPHTSGMLMNHQAELLNAHDEINELRDRLE